MEKCRQSRNEEKNDDGRYEIAWILRPHAIKRLAESA